jgi:prepilin-type N-terminal cleavage/methylation domain-containing protein
MLKLQFTKWSRRAAFQRQQNQNGFTLIEVLIVIALTTLIVAGVLVVMGTSSKILVITNTRETAKDIAISDMEYVISQPYYNQANQTSYQLPSQTQNYVATLNITDVTWNAGAEEEIDITITLNGVTLFTLTDFRTPYAD